MSRRSVVIAALLCLVSVGRIPRAGADEIATDQPAQADPAAARGWEVPSELTRYERVVKQTTAFEFDNLPLSDVAHYFADKYEINIVLDHRGLADAAVDAKAPITIDIKRPITLESALHLILDPLDLTIVIQDEVLKITSKERAEFVLTTFVYPVDDLLPHRRVAAPLLETITSTILPDSWDENGGLGLIHALPVGSRMCLVVNQTPEVHARIRELLRKLRLALVLPEGTSEQEAAAEPRTAVYHVLAGTGEDVADAIRHTVAPSSWRGQGGSGEVRAVEQKLAPELRNLGEPVDLLVVLQTDDVHDAIAELLDGFDSRRMFLRKIRSTDDLGFMPGLNGVVPGVAPVRVLPGPPPEEAPAEKREEETPAEATDKSAAASAEDRSPRGVCAIGKPACDETADKGNEAPKPRTLEEVALERGLHVPDATASIERALAMHSKFDFQDMALSDVVESCGDQFDINIRLDPKGLADVAVDPSAPVTFRTRRPMPFESALRTMLDELDLMFVIQDDMLKITSREREDEIRTTKVYVVEDLLSHRRNVTPLIDAILNAIQPDSWEGNGGPGTIQPISIGGQMCLVVSQTRDAHTEIRDVLKQLREEQLSEVAVQKAVNPQAMKTVAYHVEAGIGEQLADVLRRLVEPKSWSGQGGEGEVSVIALSREAGTMGASHDVVIVRQSGAVLQAIEELMIEIKSRPLRWQQLGGMGGGFGRASGFSPPIGPTMGIPNQNAKPSAPPEEAPAEKREEETPAEATDKSAAASAEDRSPRGVCAIGKPACDETADKGNEAPKPRTLEEVALERGLHVPDATASIERALAMHSNFDFQDLALSDVVESCGDQFDINIRLDPKGLADAAVDPSAPVTFRTRRPIPFESALRTMLDELDLMFVIQDDMLKITSREKESEIRTQKVYVVEDLLSRRRNVAPLLTAISNSIKPDSWDENGGPATMQPLSISDRMYLVISQTRDAHTEIRDLLKQLRADLPSAGAAKLDENAVSTIRYYVEAGTGQQVADALCQLVSPSTWDGQGGEGEIAVIAAPFEVRDQGISRDVLIIRQSQGVHDEIDELLGGLPARNRERDGFGC